MLEKGWVRAYDFRMRLLLCLAIAACYAPEPRGPRTVCNGVAVSYAMAVDCEEIPAEPCWNDDSEECTAASEARREHNERVHTQRVIIGSAVVVLSIIALIYASP